MIKKIMFSASNLFGNAELKTLSLLKLAACTEYTTQTMVARRAVAGKLNTELLGVFLKKKPEPLKLSGIVGLYWYC